jgi:alkylation response protein AidB-like acyl-CoA dehydrogenase
MPFALTDEERDFRDAVRRFAEAEVRPLVAEAERAGEVPRSLWRRMGELGFLGVRYPEEVGGAGGTMTLACLLMEELYRVGPGVAAGFEIHVGLGTQPLAAAGTPGQVDAWLRPALAGEVVCAFAMTEPGAGSDAAGIRTTAHAGPDGWWTLDGSKLYITNGGIADFALVTARTDEGISLFVVERGDPGFSAGPPLDKLGLAASVTAALYFDGCRLPPGRLVGAPGQGLDLVRATLDEGRLLVGAESLGIAKASFERALGHARVREQFGRPIGKFQAVRFRLADMAVGIEAAEQLVYAAARTVDSGRRATLECAAAKLFASELATSVAHDALLTLGGAGYMRESEVERHYRDAVLNEIVEGTSDVQRIVIARELGL